MNSLSWLYVYPDSCPTASFIDFQMARPRQCVQSVRCDIAVGRDTVCCTCHRTCRVASAGAGSLCCNVFIFYVVQIESTTCWSVTCVVTNLRDNSSISAQCFQQHSLECGANFVCMMSLDWQRSGCQFRLYVDGKFTSLRVKLSDTLW